MDLAILVVVVYGLFTVFGGAIGFLKAKSTASLLVGSMMGLTLLAAAFHMRRGNDVAPYVAVAIAILLGGRFFVTWKRTKRFAPDLLMVLLSLITLIVVASTVLNGL